MGLLTDIVDAGCTLTTIPSVVYEFSRGSRTIQEYSGYLDFINGFGTTVFNRIEETIDEEMKVFLVAYNKAFAGRGDKKAPSYTDSLLCATAYKFRNSDLKLITANYRDIPDSIFDRDELITIDVKGELRNEAIYSFSASKFGRILTQLEA